MNKKLLLLGAFAPLLFAGCSQHERVLEQRAAIAAEDLAEGAKSEEASPTADYELVAPLPREDGIYLFYNNETGQVCHFIITRNQSGGQSWQNPATALDCDYVLTQEIAPNIEGGTKL